MLKRMADIDIKFGLKTVLNQIEQAVAKRPQEFQHIKPVLVAVSKLKPANLIIDAYDAGQRHFGENYVQELFDKGTNRDILEKCAQIKWHFIGHLQSNKVNKVLQVPNLYLVETVDSEKLANNLNKNWPKFRSEPDGRLRVMIQVNTSAEDEKNGVEPEEVFKLASHIKDNCDNLQLEGLMTIGKYGYNPADGPNPDFLLLRTCRDKLAEDLKIEPKDLQLSMGMSTDFEQAIELGSSVVRVGSAIFGAREKKN